MGNSQQPCLDLVFLTFNRGFILHPKKSHLFLLMLIITKCWIQMSIQGAESLGFCAQAKRKESTVPLGTAALPSQWKEAEQAWPWAKGCTNKLVLRGMGKACRQSCLKWSSNYHLGLKLGKVGVCASAGLASSSSSSSHPSEEETFISIPEWVKSEWWGYTFSKGTRRVSGRVWITTCLSFCSPELSHAEYAAAFFVSHFLCPTTSTLRMVKTGLWVPSPSSIL